MDDIDLDVLESSLGFVLKSEQKEAVGSLLKGLEKAWYFGYLFSPNSPTAVSVERPTIIVICPLKSK